MSPEAAHTHARDPGLQRYPGNALNPSSKQVVHTLSNAGSTAPPAITGRADQHHPNVVTHEHRAPTVARGRPNPSNPGSQSVSSHQPSKGGREGEKEDHERRNQRRQTNARDAEELCQLCQLCQ